MLHQLVFGGLGRGDGDVAALLELVGDAARTTEAAAVLAEDVTDLGDGSVAVVRRALDQDGDAARDRSPRA